MSQQKTFEQSLAELEDVVKNLEGGNLSLDDSLAAFEKGIKLAKECEEKLAVVNGKVEKLVKDAAGGLKTESFEPKE